MLPRVVLFGCAHAFTRTKYHAPNLWPHMKGSQHCSRVSQPWIIFLSSDGLPTAKSFVRLKTQCEFFEIATHGLTINNYRRLFFVNNSILYFGYFTSLTITGFDFFFFKYIFIIEGLVVSNFVEGLAVDNFIEGIAVGNMGPLI